MHGPFNPFNTQIMSVINPDHVRPSHSITPDISPSGGPTVNLPSPKIVSDGMRKHESHVIDHQVSVIPFPLMKENAVPLDSPFLSNRIASDSPSYDAFFSGLPSAITAPPTSYEELWNSGSFCSMSSAVHSPIDRPTLAHSSNGFNIATLPSVSLLSTTPSSMNSVPLLSHSLLSLTDISMSPLLSVNYLVSFDDIPMDLLDPQYRPLSIKWKAMFQYASAYPPPSTEFNEPNPK
jgi:hypothetical protein